MDADPHGTRVSGGIPDAGPFALDGRRLGESAPSFRKP
jgi:hypothetical protein